MRCMPEIWILKAILVRGQKEKRRGRDKASIFREYIIMNRMLVEKDAKVHFGEISEGTMNVLLDNGGKAILVIKWQRTWLNCVLVFLEGRI